MERLYLLETDSIFIILPRSKIKAFLMMTTSNLKKEYRGKIYELNNIVGEEVEYITLLKGIDHAS